MELAEITPGTCYRLVNGQIVRVISVSDISARCDIFDEAQKKWVQLFNPLPLVALKEQTDDPNNVH